MRAWKRGFSAALCLLTSILYTAGVAHAATISGYAVGSFGNVLDGTGAGSYVINNNDTTTVARLEWGNLNQNQYPDADVNYFSFDGVGSNFGDPLGTTTTDMLFSMGNFTYYNAPTRQDKVDGTDFTIDIHISGYGDSALFFKMITENTRDNNDPLASADTVRIANMADFADPFLFTVAGQDYLFQLMGFSRDSGQSFETFATSLENSATTAEIYGKITVVPLPAALWFLLSGILSFVFWVRKRHN